MNADLQLEYRSRAAKIAEDVLAGESPEWLARKIIEASNLNAIAAAYISLHVASGMTDSNELQLRNWLLRLL